MAGSYKKKLTKREITQELIMASYKKRGLTKQEIEQEEAAIARVQGWFLFMGLILIIFIVATNAESDEMVHKFKSPSFSGVGTSAHYLTIENQQFNRKQALKAEIKALQDEIERDKENTTLARFIRNLESRIYAQLSRQLVENLFGETPSDSGVLTLEGNTIEYNVVDGIITLKITDSDGNTTTISLPIGSFTF